MDAIFWNKDIELNYFNIVCSSAYEKARATIVTLISSVDRVRTPECHCVPRWKNTFFSAEKFALRRISSAIC